MQNARAVYAVCGLALCVAGSSLADNTSAGANGINSRNLPRSTGGTLDGGGQAIGQVELGRPGKAGVDANGEWFWDVTLPIFGANGTYDAFEAYVDLDGNGAYTPGWRNAHPDVNPTQVSAVVRPAGGGIAWTNTPPGAPFLNTPTGPALPGGYTRTQYDTGDGVFGPYLDRNDSQVDAHALEVADVMIGSNAGRLGVAPNARLYSAAFFNGTDLPAAQRDADVALATESILRQDTLRAVNHSYGRIVNPVNPAPAAFVPRADGSSEGSLALDYLQVKYNSLQVTAGDEIQFINPAPGAPPLPFPQAAPGTPSDRFNGINVGFTEQVGGVFNRLARGNVSVTGTNAAGVANTRSLIDLVAPGNNISMAQLGGVGANNASGTSFAAPHVTGAVALLQDYASSRGRFFPDERFDDSKRSATVMKAVLMNSVDKIKDDGTFVPVEGGAAIQPGYLLGMEKTISSAGSFDAGGNPVPGLADWTRSAAYTSTAIPLDYRIGTGQLNVGRALKQFVPGEYQPGERIPLIGWADTSITGAGSTKEWYFNDTLVARSYLSVTLCWNRQVTLGDTDGNGLFTPGETFTPVGMADLDLYLIKFDAATNTWGEVPGYASLSTVDSTEHLFKLLLDAGQYGLRVKQFGANVPGFADTQFALAWWAVPTPGGVALLGVAGLIAAKRRRTA